MWEGLPKWCMSDLIKPDMKSGVQDVCCPPYNIHHCPNMVQQRTLPAVHWKTSQHCPSSMRNVSFFPNRILKYFPTESHIEQLYIICWSSKFIHEYCEFKGISHWNVFDINSWSKLAFNLYHFNWFWHYNFYEVKYFQDIQWKQGTIVEECDPLLPGQILWWNKINILVRGSRSSFL